MGPPLLTVRLGGGATPSDPGCFHMGSDRGWRWRCTPCIPDFHLCCSLSSCCRTFPCCSTLFLGSTGGAVHTTSTNNRVAQHTSSHTPTHTPRTRQVAQETHQAPTMHAFLSEQPPATNETAVANDQRMNTLDHAMPVRTQPHHAPHTTHTHLAAPAHGRQCLHAGPCDSMTNPTTLCAHAMLSHRST